MPHVMYDQTVYTFNAIIVSYNTYTKLCTRMHCPHLVAKYLIIDYLIMPTHLLCQNRLANPVTLAHLVLALEDP